MSKNVKVVQVREGVDAQRVERMVRDWFGSRTMPFQLSEIRGVVIQDDPEFCFKIKGSGINGGPIRFSKNSSDGPPYSEFTGPPFCVFDFEGKRMIDYSLGHDNAARGALSFNQAYQEFLMAREIEKRNIPVVPCDAWGMVEQEEGISWFSIHRWSKHLRRPETNTESIKMLLNRIVSNHLEQGIKGFSSVARHELDKQYYSYDLHPLRLADPQSDSAISMTCTLAWSLTIERISANYYVGRPAVRKIMEDVYQPLGVFSSAEMDQFEDWSTVELAGLTQGDGVTTADSWKPRYQKGVNKILADIQSNGISRQIYARLSKQYVHFD